MAETDSGTPQNAEAAQESRPLLGVGLMILAVLSFTLLDSIAKYLAAWNPVPQLVWGRYFFSLLLMLLFIPRMGFSTLVRTDRPLFQIARAVMLIGATGSMFMAVKFLPLAETYAISFTSPLLVALAAALLLGERVGWQRWSAIALGFLGVVLVIRPGSSLFGWAAVYPLMMAAFWAAYQIMTRMIGRSEHPVTTLFYTSMVGSVIASFAVGFFWQAPDLEAWLGMAVMGVIGFLGQLALIRAYALAEASRLSPFVYTQIVWATLIGFAVFGDLPDAMTVLGAGIVIASSLTLVWRRRSPTR